jgi:hypothetical protein
MFEISVEHLTGRNKSLNVESNTHTCELAQMVSEQMPMLLPDGKLLTRSNLRLFFGGKELFTCGGSCDKTCQQLQDYKIEAGATVNLVLKGIHGS